MEAIPFGVDEVRALARLLTETHHALAAYTHATWDGHTARLYRETEVKAKELEDLAKRYEDRYERELAAG